MTSAAFKRKWARFAGKESAAYCNTSLNKNLQQPAFNFPILTQEIRGEAIEHGVRQLAPRKRSRTGFGSDHQTYAC